MPVTTEGETLADETFNIRTTKRDRRERAKYSLANGSAQSLHIAPRPLFGRERSRRERLSFVFSRDFACFELFRGARSHRRAGGARTTRLRKGGCHARNIYSGGAVIHVRFAGKSRTCRSTPRYDGRPGDEQIKRALARTSRSRTRGWSTTRSTATATAT
jgi:hypothetical protein